ncbi:uncharacterized protein [Clytia hemisphaerica]|uniref:Uncharacterized protein n=1 Tax=Clytia hemisphaerica TaxID=252671 RepID=A0A7M5VAU7_9CNID
MLTENRLLFRHHQPQQRRTVGKILRLYNHRRRDSITFENTILSPLKRSMSENGYLNAETAVQNLTITTSANTTTKPQFKRQKSLDLEEDQQRSVSPSSSPKMFSSPEGSINTNRRDSNASSDSQKSAKKPASLDEIQDLYSALQDLVKTNVSTTPLPERRTKMLSPSPMSSPRLSDRSLTVPEKTLRKISSKITPSSSFEKEQCEGSPTPRLKHRRGVSTGTMDSVINLMRISPFPGRKFSHDVNTTSQKDSKKLSTSKTPNMVSSKAGKKERNSGDHGKRWKGSKLFHRLRSKSNAELSDNDDKLSTDDEECVREKNRRMSEADALKLKRNRDSGLTPPQRKSLQEEKNKDIENLVASLTIKSSDSNLLQTPKETFTNPLNELNQLESWFEKASVALNPNVGRYILNDESSSDAASPNVRANRFRKKNGNKRTGPGIRRANSNVGTSHRNKEERRAKRNKMTSKSFDATGLAHAKSTPDLSKTGVESEDILNDTGISYKVLGQLNHFTENRVRDLTPKDNKKESKRVSLDANSVKRLPDTPLFYVPGDEENGRLSSSELSKTFKRQKSEGSMFYTEEQSKNAKNLLSPPAESANSYEKPQRSESLSTPNKSNNKRSNNNKIKNKTRPKSMFDYFDQEILGEDPNDEVWSSEEKDIVQQNNFDNNANFCRAKIMNNAHRLSLCDLTKTTVVQEKTLWDKFSKVAASKKAKALMA